MWHVGTASTTFSPACGASFDPTHPHHLDRALNVSDVALNSISRPPSLFTDICAPSLPFDVCPRTAAPAPTVRRQPEYAIVYKQKVSPEDMFLGIDPLRHAGISDAIVLEVKTSPPFPPYVTLPFFLYISADIQCCCLSLTLPVFPTCHTLHSSYISPYLFFSLEVNLPKTRLADIALDVRQSFVRVLAPSYQLKAYLPELVDEQKG